MVTSGHYKEGEGFQQDDRPQMESFMLSHQAEIQLNDSFRESRLTGTGHLPVDPAVRPLQESDLAITNLLFCQV